MSKQSRKKNRANRVSLKGARISAQKVRPVVDLIRDKSVEEARHILQFTPKKAAPMLNKLIESAIWNIEESEDHDWDVDDLYVAQAWVNEGPTMRRFKPRAMGRATRINKRSAHIHVVLEPRT